MVHLKYRPDIDGLRGIAVALVVAYHSFRTIAPGGLFGVDIFFVISGFLISSIVFESLQAGNFSIVTFYSNRIIRIFPALLVVLLSCIILGWFALFPSEYLQLGKYLAASAIV